MLITHGQLDEWAAKVTESAELEAAAEFVGRGLPAESVRKAHDLRYGIALGVKNAFADLMYRMEQAGAIEVSAESGQERGEQ